MVKRNKTKIISANLFSLQNPRSQQNQQTFFMGKLESVSLFIPVGFPLAIPRMAITAPESAKNVVRLDATAFTMPKLIAMHPYRRTAVVVTHAGYLKRAFTALGASGYFWVSVVHCAIRPAPARPELCSPARSKYRAHAWLFSNPQYRSYCATG